MVLFIAPLRQRQTCLGFGIGGLMMVLLTFSLFSATVLAEPAVAQVEEVCGLMHNLATELCALNCPICVCLVVTRPTRTIVGFDRVWLVTSRQAEAYRTVQSTKLETFSAGQRRVSGESISLTGTLVRLPSRSI